MSWPSSQEYNEAIQCPRMNFIDPELRRGEPFTNPLGIPMPRSGNFADVYELRSPGGGRWAVKCFTREVPGLRERYAVISRHLAQVRLPYFVDFTFLQQGILVNDKWLPILKMQWVEGLTLNEFVRQNADNPPMLNSLLQIWVRMAARLREAGIAHADLQHGNILLMPGRVPNALALQLVDYDGMFVPELAGSDSGETGHPCYQHPQRFAERTYSLEVDRFPLILIAAALSCLKVEGQRLWEKYNVGDNLLFIEADLREPVKSPLFSEILRIADPQPLRLVRQMLNALMGRLESSPLLEEVLPELLDPVTSKPMIPLSSPGVADWLKEMQVPPVSRPARPTMPERTLFDEEVVKATAMQPDDEAQPTVQSSEASADEIWDYVEEERARSRRRKNGILCVICGIASVGLAMVVFVGATSFQDTGKKTEKSQDRAQNESKQPLIPDQPPGRWPNRLPPEGEKPVEVVLKPHVVRPLQPQPKVPAARDGRNEPPGEKPDVGEKPEEVKPVRSESDRSLDEKEIAAKKYQKACDDARAKLLEGFETAIDKLVKRKVQVNEKLKWTTILRQEKERFENSGLIPWSEPMLRHVDSYLNSMTEARDKLQGLYKSLIEKQLRKKNFREVDDLQSELGEQLDAKVMAKWRHIVDGRGPGSILILYSNGKIHEKEGNATWTFVKGELIYCWPSPGAPGDKWIDRLRVSDDGTRYEGTNPTRPGHPKFSGIYEK